MSNYPSALPYHPTLRCFAAHHGREYEPGSVPSCSYLTRVGQVFYGYTFATAGWLALQAVPLVASPTIIITLLSPEVREATRE